MSVILELIHLTEKETLGSKRVEEDSVYVYHPSQPDISWAAEEWWVVLGRQPLQRMALRLTIWQSGMRVQQEAKCTLHLTYIIL
jgi:hypothetical protein